MQKQYVTAPPVGQQPLADGSLPKVGQWVYSPKDNTWWQVTQTDPKLTGKQPGTNLRVRRKVSTPSGIKEKESFRGRSTMYAVDSEFVPPKVFLATNVVTLGDGKKAGPGMMVVAPSIPDLGQGGYARIAETKGGKIKLISHATGKAYWTEAGSAQLSHAGGGVEAQTVIPVSETQLQDIIDATVNMTVEEKALTAIANDLAAATPAKKKKKGPTTYPGPDGQLIKQAPGVVDNHINKGQALLSDGFAPQLGQVLRDKKGNRWVIIEVGDKWKVSQKNSVKVSPGRRTGRLLLGEVAGQLHDGHRP